MSTNNPRTIEELLAMPTADIAAMSDKELEDWCAKFLPATRPLKVTQNALAREVKRVTTAATAGSNNFVADLLARTKAKAQAQTINVKKA